MTRTIVVCCSAALEKASTMLGMNHGMARLDNVWGEGGGNRPVKYLTRRVSCAASASNTPDIFV